MGYVHQAYADQYRRGHTALGTHPDTGDVLFITDTDRYSGLYVIGVQGTGKSGLLEGLIHDDALKGNAIVVIDPHGDLTRKCIAHLPQQRIAETFVLDMEDEDFPFGINLFSHAKLVTDSDRTQVIDRIMHVFEVIWPEVSTQQNLPMYLQMAVHALLETPGSTLVDMLPFLLDDEYRTTVLNHPAVDVAVRQWWHTEYDALKPDARKTRVQPLLNRLYALFMGRRLMRNIVGQRKTTISFRKAIEQKQIIFVRLPVKTLKNDAGLVGTMVVAQIHAALFSFANLPEAERPGFSLYIDEFQHFSTRDIEEMFTEGRKFGVRLTVAHQFAGQLADFLQSATMTARTKVVLRPTIDDTTRLAKLFQGTGSTIQPEDISSNAVHELLHMGSDLPYQVQVFVETYLRGLKSSGDIPVKKGLEPSLRDVLTKGYVVPKKTLPNPISSLNDLFRTVMRSGNPFLPIPANAIVGLANGGMGFYAESIFGVHDERWLVRDLSQFPRHFVGSDGDGWYWKRRPDDEREQFLHCVFHLRLTMQYLAEHPIGKVTKSTSSDVAQLLSHLPVRHAFVHASDGVWYMRTLDTPLAVDAENLAARLHFIREQTRQTYCHPRAGVETKPEPVVAEAATLHSRWEDG